MKTNIAILIASLFLTACSTNNTPTTVSKPIAKSQEIDQRQVIFLKAVKLYQSGQHNEAAKLFEEAAVLGHFKAQNELGNKYFYGLGVKQNYIKAAYWYEKSIDRSNNPVSLYNLGQMYREGLGIKQNYSKAAELYSKSANLGHAPAQHNMGHMYKKGLGVKQSKSIAIDYFSQAAKQDYPDALVSLGVIHIDDKNYKTARQLFEKAATKGSKHAVKNLAYLDKRGL